MGLLDIFFKKQNTTVITADMPTDLKALRKLRDKVKFGKENPYARRICEVGLDLYNEGKIIAKPGDPNDVGELIKDIETYIHDTNWYTFYTVDPVFELKLLQTGDVIVTDFMERNKQDPSVLFTYPADFVKRIWDSLPEYYTEGKYCPRNTAEARKYLRLMLTFQANGEKDISNRYIMRLMEVIAPGNQGRSEILKWISISYGLGAMKIQEGRTYRNFYPQIAYQAAELLLKLDTDAIGGDDIDAMLAAYRCGAEANNAYAQYKLGQFYLKGHFVEKDEAKGLELLKAAAAQRLSVAVKAVCDYYYNESQYNDSLNKKQKDEYYRIYTGWSKRVDEVEHEVEELYASVIAGGFSDGVADIPTRNIAEVPAASVSLTDEDDRVEQKDNDSVFDISMGDGSPKELKFPQYLRDEQGETWELMQSGGDLAEYECGKTGARITIRHNGDYANIPTGWTAC